MSYLDTDSARIPSVSQYVNHPANWSIIQSAVLFSTMFASLNKLLASSLPHQSVHSGVTVMKHTNILHLMKQHQVLLHMYNCPLVTALIAEIISVSLKGWCHKSMTWQLSFMLFYFHLYSITISFSLLQAWSHGFYYFGPHYRLFSCPLLHWKSQQNPLLIYLCTIMQTNK